MKRILYMLTAFVLGIFLLAGCISDKTVSSETTNPKPESVQVESTALVYLPTADARGVKAHKVLVKAKEVTPQLALETLLVEAQKDPYSVFPKTLKVEKVDIHDEVAYVIMNEAFLHPVEGGTLTEQLLLASLVNTLTEFPSIKKVTFLVKGKAVTSLSGHVDMSEPLTRMSKLILQ